MLSHHRIMSLFIMLTCIFSGLAYAEITTDGSLGAAKALPGPQYQINADLGKQTGANLFHSFEQFNIHKGESATFSGPDSVKNIISRVTGGSASWIDGKLASTIPDADLYLLNPFGIMFGSNASLDLKGSFHVSTADYLRLGDNERFYAAPQQNEVLSVAAPNSFGFLNEKPAKISVDGAKLQVAEEKNISLVGGDIEISRGTLKAPGGNIVIGEKGNVSLSDGSQISVSGTGSGSVFIRGGQFVAKDSFIQANTTGAKDGGVIDIQADSISFKDGAYIISNTSGKGKGGDVSLKASESVSFAGENSKASASRVYVTANGKEEGSGDAGKLLIEANNISFTDGALISSSTFGKGKGGEVMLKAGESVSFSGENSKAVSSVIESLSADTGEGAGDAGKLLIEAKNISFTGGAAISSGTTGKGNGGEVVLKASDAVSFAGENSKANASNIAIASKDTEKGAGNAGTLTIDAKNIAFTDGAVINANTEGKGKGGDVTLKASESVMFTGENSTAETSNVLIHTNGIGDAGKLMIEADNISFRDGSAILSNTYSKGRGGEITLKATESVSFVGENSNTEGSFIEVASIDKESGAGDAGKLTIEAENISFTNGAYINSNTEGKGKGGEITLKAAESVFFSGESSNAKSSAIAIHTHNAGDAGKLNIDAKNISFTNGAGIGSTTYGAGKGGEVSLKAAGYISFAGENSKAEASTIVVASSDTGGDTGKLTIDAKNISFTKGASIVSTTYSKGNGREVILKAAESISFAGESSAAGVTNASKIEIATADMEEGAGDAGKLTIDAKNISFTDGAYINSTSYGKGNGGEVSLKASESVSFSGESSKLLTSKIAINTDDTGNAGKLMIEADNISFMDGAAIASTTSGKGKGGEIILKAVESVSFRGENSNATEITRVMINSDDREAGAGDAGKLTIETKNILFTDGAYINSNTYGKGNGGEVILTAAETVSFSGESSNAKVSDVMTATADTEEGAGDAGKLTIEAENISFTDGANINSATLGKGNGGEVTLKARKSVVFAGAGGKTNFGSNIAIATLDSGDAGKLLIEANEIFFIGGSAIGAFTSGKGNGGEVTLKASESVSFSGESSSAMPSRIMMATHDSDEDAGDAGNLIIEAKNISFTGGANIDAGTFGKGNGGEINLKVLESVSFSGENSNSEVSFIQIAGGVGDAGKLTVDAKNIFFNSGARISSASYDKGKGGEVILKAESIIFTGESSNAESTGIDIGTANKEEGAGDAGKLTIDAKYISFVDGAYINSSTYGKGEGGGVSLKASESVSFAGENSKTEPSRILMGTIDTEEEAGDAGKLTIDAQNIAFIDGAYINSNTYGKGNGGEVSLKASESVSFTGENSDAKRRSAILIGTMYDKEGAGDAGKLTIDAKNISFADGAYINSATDGKGKGGELTLKANESVSFDSGAKSSAIGLGTSYDEEGAGDSGAVLIEAKNISFTGSFISSSTLGKGNAGEIRLKAAESVSFSGKNKANIISGILLGSTDTEESAGDAGNLSIDAKNVSFTDGAYIDSTTYGKGNSGEVSLKASESVSFTGENRNAENRSAIQIATRYDKEGAGDAGKLILDAKNISFADGAFINSGTFGKGKGREITLNAAETITFSGISSKGSPSFVYAGSYSTDENSGAGGKISVSAPKLQISGKGMITTSSKGDGQAGDIALNVGSLEMHGGASVSSDATLSGGGRITVNAKDTVHLTDSSITTNVAQGEGKGGDITIGNPDTGTGSQFVILNHSSIRANAYGQGDGGAVFVVTDNFLKSPDSLLTATSARGNQGTVKIESPDLDISGAMTVLPQNYNDASRFMVTPCHARDAGKISRLVAEGRDVLPMSPDDLLPGPVMMKNPACEEFHKKGDAEGLISSCVSEENPDTLMYAASAYRMLGYFRQAEEVLEKALALSEKNNDIRRTSLCLGMMGDLYLFWDDFGTAGKLLEQAGEAARKSEDSAIIANILNHKGNYFAAQNKNKDASDIYRESLEILGNLSEPQNELKSATLLNLARASAKTEEKYEGHEKILNLILSLPDSHDKAWNLLVFSRIADDSSADRAMAEAIRISEELNDIRTASYSFGYSGMAYLNQKKYAEATDMTRKAVFRAQQGNFPEILYYWQWQTGKIFNAIGETENTVSAYRNAIETLNPVRHDNKPCAAGIMQEVFRSGFRRRQIYDSSIRPVYTQLAEILISSAKSEDNETQQQEWLKQAEESIELLKTTDLKNYFQDECLAEKQAKKGQKSSFIPLPNTAIIYPILSDKQPGMLMRFSDGLKYTDIPMDTETIRVKLRILARHFRKSLLIGEARIKSLTTELYQWFIEPIEPELIRRNIDTLVIVPDGELWGVPFAAFYDGKQFLIEKYALAVLPAIGLTEFDKSDNDKESALMAGLSIEQDGFDPLPNVEKELSDIKSVMGGRLLMNQAYTPVNLEAEFRRQEYAHLVMSTHGVFGGSPQDTYLLAYGSRLMMNDLEKLIGLGQFRETPLDLLTLSACETALGDERAMLGLGGIAVKAGARSALATLWKVSDDSTSVLTREFYRQLKTRKVSKAEALRNAQKKLIADSRYEHPFFWAPFLLIGNWM